jgi:hypothetical protein
VQKADLAIKKGELEAFKTETDANIQILKDSAKKMLDLLKVSGEHIVSINKQQTEMISNASQTLTRLTRSSHSA